MRYWWVTQKQTFNKSFRGGYLWSPKTKLDGSRSQFFLNMMLVAPGDLILSYRNAQFVAVSQAQTFSFTAPKPLEFGKAGEAWDDVGWRINAEYHRFPHPVRAKEHFEVIKPLLREKYAPLNRTGGGNMSYLFEIDEPLFTLICGLLQQRGNTIPSWGPVVDEGTDEEALGQFDEHVEEEVASSVPDKTEVEQITKARRGQGIFRKNVMAIEPACRITGVHSQAFLVASHI